MSRKERPTFGLKDVRVLHQMTRICIQRPLLQRQSAQRRGSLRWRRQRSPLRRLLDIDSGVEKVYICVGVRVHPASASGDCPQWSVNWITLVLKAEVYDDTTLCKRVRWETKSERKLCRTQVHDQYKYRYPFLLSIACSNVIPSNLAASSTRGQFAPSIAAFSSASSLRFSRTRIWRITTTQEDWVIQVDQATLDIALT